MPASTGFLFHLPLMEEFPVGSAFHPWPPLGDPKAIQQGSKSVSAGVRSSLQASVTRKSSRELGIVCAREGAQNGGCSPVAFVQMLAPESHSEEGKMRDDKNWCPG